MQKAAATGDEAYKAGIGHFSRGDIAQAKLLLESAAASGHVEAQNLLGLIYLNGMGVACQHRLALELFQKAAEAGSREATFNLSGMLFSGFVGAADVTGALQALVSAAQLDHRAALRVLGLIYLASGNVEMAAIAGKCWRRAAALGDIHSMYFLASNYSGTAQDDPAQVEAAYWLVLAAHGGLPFAMEKLPATGGVPDPVKAEAHAAQHRAEAAGRTAELRSLPLPDASPYAAVTEAQRDPAVLQREHAVPDALCEYLVHLAFGKLQPSSVIDPLTGQGLRTVLRTSYSMNLLPSMYDVAVGALCNRMAALVGVPFTQAEPLVVLKYLPGQEYKPHFDYVPNADTRGQRIATALLYLNEPAGGGETDFPRLGIRVTPQRGKAIGFYNCDANGAPDSRTLHAGLPVTQGEKWLATLWFRERRYDWSA